MKFATWMSLLLIMGMLSACATVYTPSAHHTHLLDKKGELDAALYTGTNGVDGQVAYAISDNIGLAAAASFGKQKEEGSSDYHKHGYGEAAIEYFKPFGAIGRFELMGGAGAGTATAVDTYDFLGPNRVEATGNYNKLFIQSNIGVESRWVAAGLALRLGRVAFTKFETSSATDTDTRSSAFFEPAAFVRLGWRHIKLESQLGLSAPLKDNVGFDYEPFLFNIGIHFNLDTL